MLYLFGGVWLPPPPGIREHQTNCWTYILDLDLTSLTNKLDSTASEIVAYQRDTTVQRKDLAQKTKDFRKLDDASKLTEIKGLLKGMLLLWNTVCTKID